MVVVAVGDNPETLNALLNRTDVLAVMGVATTYSRFAGNVGGPCSEEDNDVRFSGAPK
jgi:hypothetical protein